MTTRVLEPITIFNEKRTSITNINIDIEWIENEGENAMNVLNPVIIFDMFSVHSFLD